MQLKGVLQHTIWGVTQFAAPPGCTICYQCNDAPIFSAIFGVLQAHPNFNSAGSGTSYM